MTSSSKGLGIPFRLPPVAHSEDEKKEVLSRRSSSSSAGSRGSSSDRGGDAAAADLKKPKRKGPPPGKARAPVAHGITSAGVKTTRTRYAQLIPRALQNIHHCVIPPSFLSVVFGRTLIRFRNCCPWVVSVGEIFLFSSPERPSKRLRRYTLHFTYGTFENVETLRVFVACRILLFVMYSTVVYCPCSVSYFLQTATMYCTLSNIGSPSGFVGCRVTER